jgi:hypothetical protein
LKNTQKVRWHRQSHLRPQAFFLTSRLAFQVDISEDELRQLIHTLEGNPNATELTITGFANYLSSHEHNCAYDRKAAHEIYHDMNQPITHYFISSSHNTYLTGDQLYSKSSPDMYTKVLTEACRCVERS